MREELTHNQLKAINSLIKKELENLSTEFIYFKDLYVPLEDKLKGFSTPPFTSISSLTKYFKSLENKKSLHSIPYLYREKPNSKWKFYKIEHKPILEKAVVSVWIDDLCNKIHEDGLIHLPKEDFSKRKDLLNRLENIEKESTKKIPETVMTGSISYCTWALENQEYEDSSKDKLELKNITTLIERDEEFFERNLGADIEYNEENKRRLIFKLICAHPSINNQELSVDASIIYLTDQVYIANSVSSYLDKIKEISKDIDKEKGVFYRGQERYYWKDDPSLYRSTNGIKKEHIIFKEIVLNNPREFSEHHTTFEKLTKMQHYELPTRLLDITSNPLVALYFATANNSHDEKPSEVILYALNSKDIKYFDSDHVSVISNLAKREKKFSDVFVKKYKESSSALEKDKVLEEFNKSPEVKYLLHSIKGEKPYFEPLIIPTHLFSSAIVKSKLDNERIKKQDGAFIIVGLNEKDPNKPAPIDFHVKNKARQKVRIIIPDWNNKETGIIDKIRKELDTLCYNKGSLFPEIMNSANYIKNKYLA